MLTKTQREIIMFSYTENPAIKSINDIPYPLRSEIELCWNFPGLEVEVDLYIDTVAKK